MSCARQLVRASPHSTVVVAAVTEDLQDQEGLGQEGQAEQTYPTVDQVQDRQQNQVISITKTV